MEEVFGSTLVADLIEICQSNAKSYEKDNTENGQRMRLGFLGIVDQVKMILPLIVNIKNIMSAYDYDESTPGNGYRSFIIVVHASFKHALELCNYISINKDSLIFRKGFYVKEVEAVSHMIASLVSCFKHLGDLVKWCEQGDLFPSAEHCSEILLQQSENINQCAFYGRCLGIQFCASVQPLLKMISIFMASFSEIYYNIGSFSAKAQGLFSGGKFLLDPELRAQRIVNISQYAGIDFCKSFWFLTESELMRRLPDFVCSRIAVNAEIKIPPEPLEINNSLGQKVDIPIPSSHIPVSSIQVRLLSNCKRKGMIAVWSEMSKKANVFPPSRNLIFHCHGGGFVAQSSKSHEVYLRDWACSMDAPILSVDYSLAPEAPYPRALEEVFYSYCWAVKNSRMLGWTGENIVLAGDSAGANLILGVALKCIEYNVRKPDGLFLAYVPVIVSSTPSPSRLLCLMDPLLPMGFLLRCLKAYACPQGDIEEGIIAEEYKEDSTLKESTQNKLNMETDANYNSNLYTLESFEFCASSYNGKYLENSTTNRFKEYGQESKIEHNSSETYNRAKASIKNYKNALNTMKKKVSDLMSSTFKIESRNIDKALMEENNKTFTSDGSWKDFRFSVPKDPYLSPYWASDEVLKRLPPTSICTVEFDPCLDDCVMFAKKLRCLGNIVILDILEGLPHGFLNLSKVNKDADKGSKFCIERIRQLLSTISSPEKNTIDADEKSEKNE